MEKYCMDDIKNSYMIKRKSKRRIIALLASVPAIITFAFLVWTAVYYHAGESVTAALQSDETVTVKKTSTGWMFDGPSDETAFIFYPGAKVEETSYAPLLHRLAEEEMDVFLVKMPLRLAFFGINKADQIIDDTSYSRYLIGGHSLGGAMAAGYAADHEDEIAGMILLAAYPVKETKTDTLVIYGSEDGVLNMDRVRKAGDLVSGRYRECVIQGGNHAQFGDYGEQRGDGKATITAEDQQIQTIAEIRDFAIK